MTRTNAREIAMHMVFAMDYTDELPGELLLTRFEDTYYDALAKEADMYAEKPDEKSALYIETVVRGVFMTQRDLDGFIQKYAIGWNLDRISKLAKAIMRVSMYEILYLQDVSAATSINEAIELTRCYEDEDTVSFVNGIMGSFVRGELQ